MIGLFETQVAVREGQAMGMGMGMDMDIGMARRLT
jgi:hypothetical protein